MGRAADHDAVALGQRVVGVAVAVDGRVGAAQDGDRDRRRVGERDRPVRERMGRDRHELAALAMREGEWAELGAAQSRLANAAALIDACSQAADALEESDEALTRRVAQVASRLSAAAAHDPALAEVVALIDPARIQLEEAARALRDYRRRLDLDPADLARIDERLAALHDVARTTVATSIVRRSST